MKLLVTDEAVMDMDGTPFTMTNKQGVSEQLVAKRALAILLGRKDEKVNPMKFTALADKFFKAKGEIELDQSDYELIDASIIADPQYNAYVKGQLQLTLREWKVEEKVETK